MAKIRILIIEDDRSYRAGITAMLNTQADMVVAGAIGSRTNGMLKAERLQPHVILMDVSLKNGKDASAVASIREKMPDAKIIGMGFVLSKFDIVEFVEAGASGFILKDSTVMEFRETIQAVAKGMNVLPPSVTHSLFSHIIDVSRGEEKAKVHNDVHMTKREQEIMNLIASAMSNKEIASALNIATHTVKSHVHNIMEKLALHSRLQIAKFKD